MSFQLINNIIKKPWAIDPEYAASALPFLIGVINNENIKWEGPKSESPYSFIDSRSTPGSLKEAPKGSLAVIKMAGPLMKQDQFCGPVGMETIGQWIQEADANPNIDGILLQIDSPGGTVDGTENLSRIVSSTKKPIVGYADGLMASAAYWIGSAADEIVGNGKTTMVGSIGTMMSFADMQPVFEKAGVKFHEVFATKSEDKNKSFRQARTEGSYENIRSEFLDPLNEVFLSTVENNRKDKLKLHKENVLTGKMYHAEDAKKHGLIDSIGSFDTAVKSLRNLIDNKSKKKMSNAKQFAALTSLLGWEDGFEATEEGVHIQLADLALINSNLEIKVTQESLITSDSEIIDGLKAQVTALTMERDEFKAQAEKYGKMSSRGSIVAATEDAIPGSNGEVPSYESDANPINAWFDARMKNRK